MPGLLVLNGGDEFRAGNEPQDRLLVAGAERGSAYLIATAAIRQRPELAVANGKSWFAGLGLAIEELPVRTRGDAQSEELARRAAGAGLFYLVGGDPGLVARTLAGSRVWASMVAAWEDGAAMAGSSAGAMALCQWTLVMARWPRHDIRRPVPALGLVPDVAVLPHYDKFGQRWRLTDAGPAPVLLGPDERTAAVWTAGGWRAQGAGAVTVITGDASRRFGAGDPIAGLPAPGPRLVPGDSVEQEH